MTPDYTQNGYRLPSEAEWEFACRAGTTNTYYWGNAIFNSYLWYSGNSGSTTHAVKTKLPNAWGLYDMSGNVAEWCGDWYAPYQTGVTSDYFGPNTGTSKVVRGSGYNSSYPDSARRDYDPTNTSYAVLGFRVVKRALVDSAAAVSATKTALAILFAQGDSANSVISNIGLPSAGLNGVTISWASSDTTIVSNTGLVTLPTQSTQVDIIATIASGTISDTKSFTINVVGKLTIAYNALAIGFAAGDSANSVTQKVTLPISDPNGTIISWVSSDPSAISSTGVCESLKAEAITMTATLSLNSLTEMKIFPLTLNAVYPIGGTGPAGGIVFYDQGAISGGWRYKEVAPSDQSTGTSFSYAYTTCNTITIGGYSGWHLAEKDELAAISIIDSMGLGGLSHSNTYWSNTGFDTYNAWAISFSGTPASCDTYPKTNVFLTRAVRNF